MAGPTTTTVQCQECGTQFDATNTAEVQNHQGHTLVKIEQG
jgi:hypothetical protein